MVAAITALIEKVQPDITVVLGDIDHTHEKLGLYEHRRSIDGLRAWRAVSKRFVVMIGNHDRPHNNVYMTEEHSFNALKEWPKTTVVDKTTTMTLELPEGDAKAATYRFAFVPYVPTDRFAEALEAGDLKAPYSDLTAIFAHQEFKGAKMNPTKPDAGDPWPLECPICISGHEHNYKDIQPNLIYVGTPIAHGFGDTSEKTVSVFTFSADTPKEESKDGRTLYSWKQVRHSLGLPRKIQVTKTVEEMRTYVPPPGCHVRIRVTGSATAIKELFKLEHIQTMLAQPHLKIVPVTTPEVFAALPVSANVSFQARLAEAIAGETLGVQQAYKQLWA